MKASVAQLEEHHIRNVKAVGPIPTAGSKTELKGFFETRRWDALRACDIITDFENRCELGTIKTP